MKKVCISIFLALIIILTSFLFCGCAPQKTAYLRIHIRANSNSVVDQEVKYLVKEALVNYITPKVNNCDTIDMAKKVINSELNNILDVATSVLEKEGFFYGASAKIKNELFPTRVYQDLTLESGYYDALIVNLGDGAGENWWCVVYPPLCFSKGTVNYQSKIVQLINRLIK